MEPCPIHCNSCRISSLRQLDVAGCVNPLPADLAHHSTRLLMKRGVSGRLPARGRPDEGVACGSGGGDRGQVKSIFSFLSPFRLCRLLLLFESFHGCYKPIIAREIAKRLLLLLCPSFLFEREGCGMGWQKNHSFRSAAASRQTLFIGVRWHCLTVLTHEILLLLHLVTVSCIECKKWRKGEVLRRDCVDWRLDRSNGRA